LTTRIAPAIKLSPIHRTFPRHLQKLEVKLGASKFQFSFLFFLHMHHNLSTIHPSSPPP
jgi:hypothetical protein